MGLLCGCDSPVAEDAGVADAATDAGEAAGCESDVECDDGLFCNGAETCDPSSSMADADGCVAAADPCAGNSCDETTGQCTGTCTGPADADLDGFDSIACGGADCDDNDPARFPTNVEICDPDNRDEDCDPTTFGVRDLDGDGEPDAACCNVDDSGTATCGTDCDDVRSSVSPRLPEICDGLDNDCNGDIDDGVLATFYIDSDEDGHGSAAAGAATMTACFAPAGFVASNNDCDDNNGAVNPGTPEICDTSTPPVDEDCDGEANPSAICSCDFSGSRPCTELGLFGVCAEGTYTCMSGFPSACSIPPSAEVCDGSLSEDCDMEIDENATIECFPDTDNDGYAPGGVSLEPVCSDSSRPLFGGCPNGYTNRQPVAPNIDCEPANSAVNPGAPELCNGMNEDCDGSIDEGLPQVTRYTDTDGDGEAGTPVDACEGDPATSPTSTDCNECDPQVNDAEAELCDGKDNNCSLPGSADCMAGPIPDGVAGGRDLGEDMDGDGFAPIGGECQGGPLPETDCNDDDALSNPDASEYCGAGDNDCDLSVDEEPSASVSCTLADAFDRCVDGACRVLECQPGFGDCDSDESTGCETDVLTDVDNCGGCGVSCGTGGACVDGLCDLVIDMAVGRNHACAVREGGRMVCWGEGGSGRLGSTTTGDEGRPTLVRDGPTSVLEGVTHATAGQAFTCALLEDGTATCWGAGGNGQLGDGANPGQRLTAGMLVGGSAAPLSDIVELAAGRQHACARVSNGDVYCWGDNAFGQTGEGAGVGQSDAPARVALTDAVQLALGDDHSCARISGGDVRCWGRNQRGQVGDGTTTGPVYAPSLVTGFGSIESRDIAAGRDHTCVRRNNLRVACWGHNGAGQLGVDPGVVSERGSAAVVPGLEAISHVSMGRTHSCARDQARQLWCWGSDDEGQLGDGTVGPNVFVPQRMQIAQGGEVTDARPGIAGGGEGFHCFARASGQLACVGQQRNGRLGNGLLSMASVALPTSVLDITRPTHVAPGEEHTCARFDVGRMACWGDNSGSQLGTADDPLTVTTRAVPTGVQTIDNARLVRSGRLFSCALRSTGQVVCWGTNDEGQLGNDDLPNPSSSPVGVSLPDAAIDVQTGSSFACALLADRRVFCWGRGVNGQLGDGASMDSAAPVEVSSFDAPPVRLRLGGRHACVIEDDASIQCWGHDNRRQLNDGSPGGTDATPSRTVERDLLAIELGAEHTCGITGAGALRCWGANGSGQLGRAPVQSLTPDFVETAITDWVEAATGSTHTCARRSGGEVWCWGEGSQGELGNGALLQQPAPVMTQITPADATVLTAGHVHSCVIHVDGSISCWGRNDFGQLGDAGAPTDRETPVPVLLMP